MRIAEHEGSSSLEKSKPMSSKMNWSQRLWGHYDHEGSSSLEKGWLWVLCKDHQLKELVAARELKNPQMLDAKRIKIGTKSEVTLALLISMKKLKREPIW
jgi:hypothetical protein